MRIITRVCFSLSLFLSCATLQAGELVLAVTTGGATGTGFQGKNMQGLAIDFVKVGVIAPSQVAGAKQGADPLGNPVVKVALTPDGMAQAVAIQKAAFAAVPPAVVMVFTEGQQLGTLDFGMGNDEAVTSLAKPKGLILTITDATKPLISQLFGPAAVSSPDSM